MLELDALLGEAREEIRLADDLRALELCRVKFLGRKGKLTESLKSLGHLPVSERPAAGQQLNLIKEAILSELVERESSLKKASIKEALAVEAIDVTLPGRGYGVGSLHPITHTFDRLRDIFSRMGFVFMDGPEIEDDFYNFTALNVPPLHPARAMQDTFYFSSGRLLRSQMSPVQIHTMQHRSPPLRMVAMGKVYRRDFDLTHTPMFHQMECLMVDKHVTFASMKSILNQFLSEFFETEIKMRLRPSYFPFTEPSAEVDIGCINCNGVGCRLCKNTGYIEILGCGMVHPNVFKMVGINSEQFRGFAFGLGIDRLTLLKYRMTDLRALFENDLRFLDQFK